MNNIKPENILLKKIYDSESIVDLGRDVLESFQPDFTPNAKNISDDKSIVVSFVFKHEDEIIIMLNRSYTTEELGDVEEHLMDAFVDLNRPDMPGFPGFFEGSMTLTIFVVN